MDELLTRPLLPLRGLVVFPGVVTNVDVGREKSMHAVEAAMNRDKLLYVTAQKDSAIQDVVPEDLYSIGVVVEIKQMLRLPNGGIRILVEGLGRVEFTTIDDAVTKTGCFVGTAKALPDVLETDLELDALERLLRESFEQWVLNNKKISAEVLETFRAERNVGRLADMIANTVNFDLGIKQSLLSVANVKKRMRDLYERMVAELEISKLTRSIAQDVQRAIEKNQREYFLREQIKVISKELGEAEDILSEIADYRAKMAALELPENVAAKIDKEIKRLAKMQPMVPESAVVRNYLDVLLGLPWGKFTEDSFDMDHAQKILDRDHYGLKKVKERILEFLAVRALSKTSRGPIICLVGPPGVGKTSLAHSVAEAINRKFTRVSLGGIRDEAEIRGHRRTYVGALPGRIIQGMQNAGCMNPLFLLDEVDKMASDFKGDPAAALLEALDPEQNNTFADHYVEESFDLSNVFWIITANSMATIPPALLDRMEIIELSSYTDEEKVQIAKRHLLPKNKKLNGLEGYRVSISEKAIARVIHDYTREAGVRELERKIANIYRKAAFKIAHGECKGAVVNESNLEKFLGPVIYKDDDINISSEVGVVNGLAWTSVGGELLKVEVLVYKGKGNFSLTGQLGDVMKESAQAAFTYVKSLAGELGLEEDYFDTHDFHIHLPEGAVPKDGPSAGVTLITALVSAITGRAVKEKLAMTGEISLTGKVWPIGGLKEKVLAAYRYGVRTVLLPERNLQDLDEVPEHIRAEMNYIPVKTANQVLENALI
ncbi:MAG: endopeptidase La [Phascolarctobacterium sp.]|nr:endopeptidase La [Phascolarctobacterium sp.]